MNWSIGLTGLDAAQRAIELVGTNISNAATEGYHRQDLQLAPIVYGGTMQDPQGVEVAGISRAVDTLLERELMNQQPTQGQIDRELTALETIESVFGEVDSEGLASALDGLFNAFRELSSDPNSQPLRQQAVWSADALTTELRRLGTYLTDLKQQIVLEAGNAVNQVNALAGDISTYNRQIETMNVRGGNPNVLLDKRDQALTELGTLIETDISYPEGDSGAVTVMSVGTPLSVSNVSTGLATGITMGGKLGIAAEDSASYTTRCDGGKLGGLLSLHNEIIPDLADRLDTLAATVADQVNRLHAQGVGSNGAFTELIGLPSSTEAFSDWNAEISAGALYVRITNTDTNTTTRHQVDITTDMTLSDVATTLDGLTDADGTTALSASIAGGALRLQSADADVFTFDFLPAPLADTSGGWSGTSSPSAGGIYTGASNDEYTLTVSGAGTIGTGDLSLEIRDGGGALLDTVAIGAGYAPGDRIDIGDGLNVSLSGGTVTDGESFTVLGLLETDETGLLAAAGVNTLFAGRTASTLGVRQDVLTDPRRLACSVGADMTDNTNVRRMAEIGEQTHDSLDGLTCADASRELTTTIGQAVTVRRARRDGLETVVQQLMQRRDEIGGVDVNEEAAKLLIFEQMFQGVAKFMSTQEKALRILGELL
ncbi:MAG: flagellar hook-associated protein FlgK [Phycisphaerae bacterium]|nr:flagellar hook-associated protein FlgK [Phycisphaerae bacterium]